MNILMPVVLFLVFLLLTVVLSMIIEGLRKPPPPPAVLCWSTDIPIQYLDIGNMRIRYIKTGQGPNLVLLHTLRTQFDIFQKIIPDLSRDFTVYALDYPGHGFSGIVNTDYVPELFVDTVEKFMEQLNIENTMLAGISIGGTIPLLIAAKHNPRVKKVVSINPYDYGKGRGVERGNFTAWLIFTLARIPVVGETVMRFRNPMVENRIMEGGVAFPQALPGEFLQQIYEAGVRKGHYRAFINLIRNAGKWENAHGVYGRIKVPVLIVYGENDWSNDAERQRTLNGIPGARLEIVANGGHFLSLDQPERVMTLIKNFASA